jgi:four helix bundle protein
MSIGSTVHRCGMDTATCKSHSDLVAWQKAMDLAVEVHRVSDTMPRHERFGLVSQLRRAAVSVPSNIAEGSARRTTRDFIAFLHVARGSIAAMETQMLLAQRVGYLSEQQVDSIMSRLAEVGRLLNGLIAALQRRLELRPSRR